MAKRSKLEIMRDILRSVQASRGGILKTPLIRKSNVSTTRFNGYFNDLIDKGMIEWRGREIILTDKGSRFLMKYKLIVEFIDEFEL